MRGGIRRLLSAILALLLLFGAAGELRRPFAGPPADESKLGAPSPADAAHAEEDPLNPASDASEAAAQASVSLSAEALTIGVGEIVTDELICSVAPASLAEELRWSSSNARCVRVDARSGAITGVRVGSATVTVSTGSGLSAACQVVVQKAPGRVALRLPMSTFSVGQIQTAQLSFSGCGHYRLASSDPEVVAVEEDGLLRALREGEVTITATTYNNKTASARLRVCPAPTELHPAAAEAIVGEGLQIQAEFAVDEGSCTSFRYAIADPELAQVDEDGCVTGLKRGHTQLIARTHNGLTASMELEILPAPERIRFDGGALTLGLGELRALEFTVEPENALGGYSYASDNPRVVRVSDDGMLSGMRLGTVRITVTAQSGASAVLEVEVVPYCEANSALCMAHRGASGYRPGNSLAAFQYAAALGADMVELDVRRTQDGQIVVFHDSALSCNGRRRAISSLSMSAIRIADPNVCTLEEALNCIAPTGMQVMIEFKTDGIEAEVLECVRACGMQVRAIYGSFVLAVIDRIKALQPSAETVYIVKTPDALNRAVTAPEEFSADYISASASILTPASIYWLHLGGKRVVAWTVNSRSGIERYISMGVDGITTDYPDYM